MAETEAKSIDARGTVNQRQFLSARTAAGFGNLELLKEMIQETKILDCSQLKYNLFHYSFLQPHIIAYLTDEKLKIYLKFNDQTHAIHAAAFGGKEAEVEKLITEDKTNLFKKTVRNESVFYWAACGNQFELANKLLAELDSKILKDEVYLDILKGAQELIDALVPVEKFKDAADIYEKMLAYNLCLLEIDEEKANEYFTKMNQYLNLADLYDAVSKIELYPEGDFTNDQECGLMGGRYFNFVLNRKLDNFKKAISCLDEILAGFAEWDCTISHYRVLVDLNKIREEMIAGYSKEELPEKWGLTPVEVSRDGNCLFYAISHQISLNQRFFASQYTHQTLRALAVSHLSQNKETYKNFYSMPDSRKEHFSLDQFMDENFQKLSQNEVWADDYSVLALARELNVTIVIIPTNIKIQPTIFKSKNSICTFYIFYENGAHYQSAVIQDIVKVENTIGSLVADTLVDNAVYTRVSANEQPEENATLSSRILKALSSPKTTLTQFKALMDEEKFDINEFIDDKKPIYVAAQYASLPIFAYLVEECGVNLNKCGDVNLFYPAMTRPDILKYLTSEDNDLYVAFDDGTREIDAAVVGGNQERMHQILNHNPGLIDCIYDEFTSLFYWAALVGNDNLITEMAAHFAFEIIKPDRQCYLYEDALRAKVERIEKLNGNDNLENKLIECKTALFYAAKIYEFNPIPDNLSIMLNYTNKIAETFDSMFVNLLTEQDIAKAIKLNKILIQYSKAFPDKLRELEKHLVQLWQTQEINSFYLIKNFLKKRFLFYIPDTDYEKIADKVKGFIRKTI